MSKINEKNEDTTYKYGCLMVKVNLPDLVNISTSILKEEDIFNDKDNSYGIESEPHVTILYGLHNDIDHDKILHLCKILKPINLSLTDISLFENEYDVLKFDVESSHLELLNELVKNTFKYTNDYPDYKAHLTIAYLNKGTGKNYINNEELKKLLSDNITITDFYYSTAKGEKYFINVNTGLITKINKNKSKEFIFLSEEDLINYKINTEDETKDETKDDNVDINVDVEVEIEEEENSKEEEEEENSIDVLEEKVINDLKMFNNDLVVQHYNNDKKIPVDLLEYSLIDCPSIEHSNDYIIDFKNKNNNITDIIDLLKIKDNIYLCNKNGFVVKYFDEKIDVMGVIEYLYNYQNFNI